MLRVTSRQEAHRVDYKMQTKQRLVELRPLPMLSSDPPPSGALSAVERLRVVDMAEVYRISSLSEATFGRLYAAGEGPPRIRLSARRWGVQLGALADWLSSRTDKSAAA